MENKYIAKMTSRFLLTGNDSDEQIKQKLKAKNGSKIRNSNPAAFESLVRSLKFGKITEDDIQNLFEEVT
jgi:ACT domain-containing protein